MEEDRRVAKTKELGLPIAKTQELGLPPSMRVEPAAAATARGVSVVTLGIAVGVALLAGAAAATLVAVQTGERDPAPPSATGPSASAPSVPEEDAPAEPAVNVLPEVEHAPVEEVPAGQDPPSAGQPAEGAPQATAARSERSRTARAQPPSEPEPVEPWRRDTPWGTSEAPESSTASAPVAATGQATPEEVERQGGPGQFDPAIVARTIRARIRAIQTCYERQLRDNPTLAGRIIVRFTIQPTGTVSGATATENGTGSPAVAACLVSTISRFRFNPGPEGGPVTFAYPFVLSPTN